MSRGFTLIEAVLATALLSLIGTGTIGTILGSVSALRESHLRTLALARVGREAERIMALDWNALGLTTDSPPGQISPTTHITENGFPFTITTTIVATDDPYDGLAPYDDNAVDRKKFTIVVRSPTQKSSTPLATLTLERAPSVIPFPHCAPLGVDSATVGRWNFEETSGTTINDLSATHANGTLTRGLRVDGRLGRGIEVHYSTPSLTEYVGIPVADGSPLDIMSPLTVEANVTLSSAIGTQTIIGRLYDFEIWLESGVPVAGVFDRTAGWRTVRGMSTLTLNTWTHLAMTFDGTTLKLWRNGIRESQTNTSSTSVAQNNYQLRIGNGYVAGDFASQFRGRIDQVVVSNVARICTP